MVTQVINDPFEAASNAAPLPKAYYGQVEVDAWFCVLVKGQGRVPFDPQQHGIDQRRTAIDMAIIPVAASNLQYPLERKMLAESKEWRNIVWPSLKALGFNSLKEVNGAWVKVELVGTGRKYVNSAGEEKEATTFKFLAVYESEEACEAAYMGMGEAEEAEAEAEPAAEAAPAPAEAPQGNPQSNPERETALQFARVLVQQALKAHPGDLEAAKRHAAQQIATMPVVSKYFTVESPEIQALFAQQ